MGVAASASASASESGHAQPKETIHMWGSPPRKILICSMQFVDVLYIYIYVLVFDNILSRSLSISASLSFSPFILVAAGQGAFLSWVGFL